VNIVADVERKEKELTILSLFGVGAMGVVINVALRYKLGSLGGIRQTVGTTA